MLHPRCHLCAATKIEAQTKLRRCTGCRVVRYCSTEHQHADWSDHKALCKLIGKSHQKLVEEDAKVRNEPGHWTRPLDAARPFETVVGRFWSYLMTYVIDILKVNTLDSVRTALDDLLDMLRLSRSDGIGAREIVPALYIRLNRDQASYDFIKWYATIGFGEGYDWDNVSLPFLDLRDEDILESPSVRVLLDLRDIQDSKFLDTATTGRKLDFDILQYIRSTIAIRSGVWSSRRQLLDAVAAKERVNKLEKRASQLLVDIHRENQLLWRGLLEHERWLRTPFDESRIRTHGKEAEMHSLVLSNARAWVETDGALAWLNHELAGLFRYPLINNQHPCQFSSTGAPFDIDANSDPMTAIRICDPLSHVVLKMAFPVSSEIESLLPHKSSSITAIRSA
ncbi:hypothetical protein CC1G_08892 [Coprinopsis cinerea okayama7|uniref:MYND-type domain-containing protein n=1 Tax=Coprinopsis cinerea (strain Okayama-7 / 130 / ATCC MYA-4618 / FGSC 9003) TaxID=240176 RepID=A8P874_COPC7|nr:hypothetical protein CC1G_08892 [Coprinopsis cinerea okayama7\|eukprot:XP_001839513.2 hypothetical protein CC1G_08892 [Coprinopsis cinerea okayama7\